MVLLGSTIARWFDVLVDYGVDQTLNDYRVLTAPDSGSLHDYIGVGFEFEVLIVLAGLVALVTVIFRAVAADRFATTAEPPPRSWRSAGRWHSPPSSPPM